MSITNVSTYSMYCICTVYSTPYILCSSMLVHAYLLCIDYNTVENGYVYNLLHLYYKQINIKRKLEMENGRAARWPGEVDPRTVV